MGKIFTCAIFLIALVAATHCVAGTGKALGATPVHVLFIGNSFTMFNDMPRTVASMGRSLGHDLIVEVCAVGGKGFAYHRQSAVTLQVIDSAPWDVVILQDHSRAPSQRPEIIRQSSLPDAIFLVQYIWKNHAATRIIYYETWGHRDGDLAHCLNFPEICTFKKHTSALQKGYRMYRKATGGIISHVGTNWQHVVKDTAANRPFAASSLWLNDSAHPSSLGSYLAAATILKSIINAPVGASNYNAELPPDIAKYLRQVADAH